MVEATESIRIADLMDQSGVGFGTSGARGLATAMTDRVCYAYTLAFLQHLAGEGSLAEGSSVAIAGDFRPSTPRIMAAAGLAVQDAGYRPVNCGFIPTPAVTLFGMQRGIPSLMVTGSHIPDDRNGIKFNKACGEILKRDEAAIRAQKVAIPAGRFDDKGESRISAALPTEISDAYESYVNRYLDFFPPGGLQGMRIGLYEHSGVARRALGEILEGLGATVTRLGRSERFIPVDTEAVRPEDVALAREWALTSEFDGIVSADGDGDRPLVSDEKGSWLRGDILGILCARYLGAQQVVTPVSSNSALERCGWFRGVERTRIGSPYVIAAMECALADGAGGVVGYEANGGFLIADTVERDGRRLEPLPTRDAAIVPLALLLLAKEAGLPVSGLLRQLPSRFTHSDRLKNFPTVLSRQRIAGFNSGDFERDRAAIESVFGTAFGRVSHLDVTDGLRITFENEAVIHLRPSGNAPELRCYTEAAGESRAREMAGIALSIMETWR